MNIIKWIRTHRATSFLIGVVIVQGYVLASGAYLSARQQEDLSHVALDEQIERLESVTNQTNSSELARLHPESIENSLLSEHSNNEDKSLPEPELSDDSNTKKVEYTVEAGDTLSKIWQKFGAPYSGCLKAAKALEDAGLSLSSLRVGDVIELIVGDENDIVEFRKKFSDGRTLILQGGAESGYEGQVIVPEVVEDERVVMGTINQSFSQVALEHNVPYSVVDQLVDIMGSRVEFRRDLQPGDDFALIYTERRLRDDPEHLLEPGPVSAASLTVGGKQLVAIRHVGKDGVGRYFDREGNPLDRFFLRYPLNFTRISSMFSKSRFHPVLKINRPHNGVDFAAPIGTPVRAVAGGRVTFAGWKGAAGRMIKVQHDGRYSTAYMHLSKIEGGIRQGTRIQRGQVIGRVGASGSATGPHLHYSLYDHGVYVDPLKASLPIQPIERENMIAPGYLKAVLRTLSEYRQLHLATLSVGE